jgi:hypothetical protein
MLARGGEGPRPKAQRALGCGGQRDMNGCLCLVQKQTIVRTRRPAGVASVVCTERTVDAGELAGGQVTVSLKVEGVDWRLPISIRPHWRARQLLALPLALNSLLYNLRAHVRATQNSTCMRNGEMCLCDIFTLDMYINDSCGLDMYVNDSCSKLVHAQRQRTGLN